MLGLARCGSRARSSAMSIPAAPQPLDPKSIQGLKYFSYAQGFTGAVERGRNGSRYGGESAFGFIGNLGGRQKPHGFNARLAVHPEGMSDSSRGSQRSGDPRKNWNDAVHPAGMPERFDSLRTSFHRFWHPFRMRLSFRTIPVVSAMLRPPATPCHPFGMNRNDF